MFFENSTTIFNPLSPENIDKISNIDGLQKRRLIQFFLLYEFCLKTSSALYCGCFDIILHTFSIFLTQIGFASVLPLLFIVIRGLITRKSYSLNRLIIFISIFINKIVNLICLELISKIVCVLVNFI